MWLLNEGLLGVMTYTYEGYEGVFDGKLAWGKRPALVVVDFMRAYVEPDAPFYSPDVRVALERAGELLEAARQTGRPVIFTRVEYDLEVKADGGRFVEIGRAHV